MTNHEKHLIKRRLQALSLEELFERYRELTCKLTEYDRNPEERKLVYYEVCLRLEDAFNRLDNTAASTVYKEFIK